MKTRTAIIIMLLFIATTAEVIFMLWFEVEPPELRLELGVLLIMVGTLVPWLVVIKKNKTPWTILGFFLGTVPGSFFFFTSPRTGAQILFPWGNSISLDSFLSLVTLAIAIERILRILIVLISEDD